MQNTWNISLAMKADRLSLCDCLVGCSVDVMSSTRAAFTQLPTLEIQHFRESDRAATLG